MNLYYPINKRRSTRLINSFLSTHIIWIRLAYPLIFEHICLNIFTIFTHLININKSSSVNLFLNFIHYFVLTSAFKYFFYFLFLANWRCLSVLKYLVIFQNFQFLRRILILQALSGKIIKLIKCKFRQLFCRFYDIEMSLFFYSQLI